MCKSIIINVQYLHNLFRIGLPGITEKKIKKIKKTKLNVSKSENYTSLVNERLMWSA